MAKPLISLRLDERLVRNARKVLKAKSRTQTIEMSLEAVVELNKHRKLIREPIMNEAVIPKIEGAVLLRRGSSLRDRVRIAITIRAIWSGI